MEEKSEVFQQSKKVLKKVYQLIFLTFMTLIHKFLTTSHMWNIHKAVFTKKAHEKQQHSKACVENNLKMTLAECLVVL